MLSVNGRCGCCCASANWLNKSVPRRELRLLLRKLVHQLQSQAAIEGCLAQIKE